MWDIEGENIKLSAEALAIPPFKDYLQSSKDRTKALKEIEYIVWLYKWKTPYKAYPPEERQWRVAQDVMKDKDFKPSEDLKQLIKRFIEFQNSPLVRLYNSGEEGLEFLIDTLENLKSSVSLEDVDLETRLKIAQGVSKILKDIEPTAKSLESAKKRALAEETETGRVKGGGQIGLYELPR